MNIKTFYHILAVVLLVINTSSSVYADEYVVSGNGEGSSNSINITEEKSDAVVQDNNAEVDNDVAAEANTGENQANDNTGETQIETGDANTEVVVVNEGNVNQAEVGCCPDEGNSAKISGNGSDSDNSIEYESDEENNVYQTNNLTIKNNIQINASTGNNEASDNGGNVEISTGGVNIFAAILNKKLNYSKAEVGSPREEFDLLIEGNGSDSENHVNTSANKKNNYYITNNLNLVNNIINFANTGNNKANKNLGDVKISTGNITLDLIILTQANISEIFDKCDCDKPEVPESPAPSPAPESSPPPSGGCCSPTTDIPGPGGGGGGSSSGGSSGSVLGASLPETGGISIMSLTIAALLMLLAGVILRFNEQIFRFEPKKVYREFTNNLRSFAFGLYLFTNIKVLYPLKS